VDSAQREALAQRVLALSPADATEAVLAAEDHRLTRFTHNVIHQNVAAAQTTVRVRAIIDGRAGVAATNDVRDESLERVVARACEIARLAPADPEMAPLVRAQQAAPIEGGYAQSTADASADVRAHLARGAFDAAERDGLWAAGFVETAHSGVTIANSSGTLQSFDGSDSGMNVKQNGPSSTGFAERYSTDVRDIDGALTGDIAARKALLSKDPIEVEPGEWTVILEPAAFGELAAFLAQHFSAQSFDEGWSALSGKLGERIVGENITLVDDAREHLNPGMPFDFEGTPRQRVTLLDRGVASGIVTDARWAAKLGRENTGHALPEPNAYGPWASHLVLAAGSTSLDDLIAGTKRGLLITRLWYVRTVDRRETFVTGMTRDGTFLVENGKIVRGVRNMRFNQSILAALQDCTLSSEAVRTASYSYAMVVPSVRFERFTFSSATDF